MRSLVLCNRIAIRYVAEQSSGGAVRRFCSATTNTGGGRGKEKVVVIMGATGTGKSKLSIDLAAGLPPGEVVNSDKMQVYAALDVTTNKITAAERRGVPHHLLGDLDPAAGELSPAGFRDLGGAAVSDIAARRRLPIVAGGSNSFIHALLADDPYDPAIDTFAAPGKAPAAPATAAPARLRYRCCLLWVDVAAGVLYEHLDRRVEEMVGAGMVEELAENYDPGRRRRGYSGPWRAIGVPEFDRCFERGGGAAAYEQAVREIKENTRRLADVQVGKIQRLRGLGWPMRRVDATGVVRAGLERRGKAAVQAAWERDVLGPSLEAVEMFLRAEEEEEEEEEVMVGRLRLRLA